MNMHTPSRHHWSSLLLKRVTHPWLLALLLLSILGLAPPASAEAPTGILQVSSDPAGATVYLGIRPVGQTPLSYYAPVGSHTVRVLRDGSEPYVRKITIREDQTTQMKAKLYAGKGSVEIVVDPPGAKLKVEGGDEWPTPVRLKDLKAGTYQYTLTAPGHEDLSGSFDFVSGKNSLISTTMMSSAGMIAVSSTPAGAMVLLDGEEVGLTPLHLDEVDAGEHTVQLVLRGHGSVFRRFDTSDGSKAEVKVRMPKKGIPLTISTWNKEAELTIQGVKMGPKSSFRMGKVERGRYQIEIAAPGKKTIEQSLLVPARGTALYRAKLRPKAGAAPSTLTKRPPFYQHWLFYTVVGAATTSATTMAIINYRAGAPIAAPPGDILVTMP
jgi:hypothetical protein